MRPTARRLLLPLLAGAGLLAGPTFAAEKPRIVVLGINASDPKLKQLADAIAEQVLTELTKTRRLDAMGTSDVSAVLGMERQKQMLGCTDQSSSCLAEISAALGAPWLVTGGLARAGKATRVDIKLIRARDGKAVFRDGRNFNDESEMFDLVSSMVKALVEEMDLPPPEVKKVVVADVPKVGVSTEPTTSSGSATTSTGGAATTAATQGPARSIAPWVLVGGGAVVAAVGAVMIVANQGTARAFQDSAEFKTLTGVQAKEKADGINGMIFAGGATAGLGVAALAGGLAWKVLGGSGDSKTQVTFVPGSNTLVVGGAW